MKKFCARVDQYSDEIELTIFSMNQNEISIDFYLEKSTLAQICFELCSITMKLMAHKRHYQNLDTVSAVRKLNVDAQVNIIERIIHEHHRTRQLQLHVYRIIELLLYFMLKQANE